MSMVKREYINEESYLYNEGDKTIIHIDGKDIDVTTNWSMCDKVLSVGTRNDFWYSVYKIDDNELISFYYGNKRLYTDYADRVGGLVEQNSYLIINEEESDSSYVLDSKGNIKFKTQGSIYYYNVIDNKEVVLYFDTEYVIVIDNKEQRFNWEITHMTVNDKKEICIVGNNHNATYDLQLNKIRDLDSYELKRYSKGSYYYKS